MKRKHKRLLSVSIILVIVLLVMGYMKFFNGTLIYLSTGLKNTELFKVNDNVTYTFEANLLMSDARAQYEKVFGSDVWGQEIDGKTFEEYVKDQIRTKLIRVRCMNEMAAEKGAVLSRDEKDAVSRAVDEYIAGLTPEQIEELGVTKDNLKEMFTDFALAQRLYNDMTSVMDIEVSADDARVIDIQYISSDSRSDLENAKAELAAGNSFYTVVNKYNAGGNYEYELKRGEMNEEFEDVAFNLKSGETSEIIEVDGKFYIIKCTSDNDKVKTEVNKTTILAKKQLEQFNSTFEKYEAGIYVEWNDKQWKKMSVSANDIYAVSFEEVFQANLK